MVETHSILKVKGGKLVRLRVIHDGERIVSARFTGDFMVHPEETLDRMEERLAGMGLQSSEEELARVLQEVVASTQAELIGFSVSHLTELLGRCLR